MIKSFLSIAVVALLSGVPVSLASAQDSETQSLTPPKQSPVSKDSQSKSKQTKRTNVDFEDQLVQGEVKKPELFYLLQKKQFNFGKLIKLRENFVPEMGKTAEDVEKTR